GAGDPGVLHKQLLSLHSRLPYELDSTRRSYVHGELIRASYTHTTSSTTNTVTPGEPVDYVIDVFPLGHTFRAGHQLQVQIHTPPVNDGRWGHGPVSPPAINTVHEAALTLPVIDTVDVGPYPGCGVPDGYRCVPAGHNAGVPG
ncbi:MAG: CocE/NonD family hydrolase C-terminal non-catalytic domain-containing protein, partial [Candidatus Thermoplasmatota archaeon]|nr:CocE/NonD family hydrolase C-terminal non-catalytic domain-containing protein [Candidatus Thermoplasmatota archaeon]